MIELVYETHSTTIDNENGVATGWLPGRLSSTGREEARQLGRRRADDGIAAVFTSDLARAIETVDVAFEGRIPVLHDWRLRECDYGVQNGGPTSALDRLSHIDLPYEGGESWRQAVHRVGRFLDDLPLRWSSTRLLVVGHSATGLAFAHLLNGVPLEVLIASEFEWQEGWEYEFDERQR
jgi:2,3-bisphosphoglycerate-dependent phosphoglycerate mutase